MVVCIVRTAFVSRLVMVTVAPETNALEGSFTVPRMVDVPVCPQPVAANIRAQTSTAKLTMRNGRFINCSFSRTMIQNQIRTYREGAGKMKQRCRLTAESGPS